MLLLLLFSPLAHPLVQATPRTATRQLLTTVDTSSAQPTTISGARRPVPWPCLASHFTRLTLATPYPHLALTLALATGGEHLKKGVNISVECMYEHLVEDYTEDPNDPYEHEYGVCTTLAGSGQTKIFYLPELGMPHRDRTPD